MLKEECRIGMHVYFGRKQGEKTLGVITKLNDKSCKVKILEERGSGRGGEVGKVWGVGYSLMFPAPAASQKIGGTTVVIPVIPKIGLKYSQFTPQEDIHILQAIACIYSSLSPENLFCDGEISATEGHRRGTALRKKLKGLFDAYGREVSEGEIYQWERDRRAAFSPKTGDDSEQ